MKEKRLRDKTWKDYEISKFRYRELKNFCLQYQEKKEKIQYGLSSYNMEGSSSSSGPSDPTGKKALNHIRDLVDIQMIESSAMETDKQLYPFLLKSVTQDLPYEAVEYDERYGRIPYGKTDFYAYRRRFYYILNEKKYT
ncbi:MAG: hypothetical protein IJP13_08580 [Lachnospiraceae bacterium]|nr:hypothetical protein [Lachnospiraceae bacterium]